MNQQTVVIKSNRYGITLFLDKDTDPFRNCWVDIREKFKASSKFFKDAQMALAFEGRQLTPGGADRGDSGNSGIFRTAGTVYFGK
ncbi:MAG: hypothetical protein V8S38_11595 [Lachnospiraceae bacterium]